MLKKYEYNNKYSTTLCNTKINIENFFFYERLKYMPIMFDFYALIVTTILAGMFVINVSMQYLYFNF